MPDLDAMLARTSRTFALAIPLLPEPPRQEVTTAYLLFRIADTFEDAARWTRVKRLEALRAFREVVVSLDADKARALGSRWANEHPCDHDGYLDLLANTDHVLRSLASFAPSRREIVTRHVLRTIDGMADVVTRSDDHGSLMLSDESDLRQYCYIVAGIVGELLTDLFVETTRSLHRVRATLDANARAFGEGLQLVNILKDAEDDARDGRVYLPAAVARSRVFEIAREDLLAAAEYVQAAQQAGAPRGVVAFVAFPVLLARATLDVVERSGPGAKVGRDLVASLLAEMNRALDDGRPALSS